MEGDCHYQKINTNLFILNLLITIILALSPHYSLTMVALAARSASSWLDDHWIYFKDNKLQDLETVFSFIDYNYTFSSHLWWQVGWQRKKTHVRRWLSYRPVRQFAPQHQPSLRDGKQGFQSSHQSPKSGNAMATATIRSLIGGGVHSPLSNFVCVFFLNCQPVSYHLISL